MVAYIHCVYLVSNRSTSFAICSTIGLLKDRLTNRALALGRAATIDAMTVVINNAIMNSLNNFLWNSGTVAVDLFEQGTAATRSAACPPIPVVPSNSPDGGTSNNSTGTTVQPTSASLQNTLVSTNVFNSIALMTSSFFTQLTTSTFSAEAIQTTTAVAIPVTILITY